jgi:hypothetical protein
MGYPPQQAPYPTAQQPYPTPAPNQGHGHPSSGTASAAPQPLYSTAPWPGAAVNERHHVRLSTW